jgi:hypothetical protein
MVGYKQKLGHSLALELCRGRWNSLHEVGGSFSSANHAGMPCLLLDLPEAVSTPGAVLCSFYIAACSGKARYARHVLLQGADGEDVYSVCSVITGLPLNHSCSIYNGDRSSIGADAAKRFCQEKWAEHRSSLWYCHCMCFGTAYCGRHCHCSAMASQEAPIFWIPQELQSLCKQGV